MAAREVFKSEQDEDERGDLQQPERQHCHGVGQEKLQQRRQQQGKQKHSQRRPAGRRHNVAVVTRDEYRQRHDRHGHESDAPREEQAEAVPQVIHRFQQKLADVPLADVRGDLPVILIHRREHIHHRHHQIVKDHLRLGETGMAPGPGVARVDGAPQREHGEERDETEQRPGQVVEPVGQVVLQPNVDDVQVFSHPRPSNITGLWPKRQSIQWEGKRLKVEEKLRGTAAETVGMAACCGWGSRSSGRSGKRCPP